MKVKIENIFLKGSMCVMVPLEDKDIAALVSLLSKWVNDEVVTYYMFTGQTPINKRQLSKNIKDDFLGNNLIFLILSLNGNKIVGYCGLYDIHKTARKAEFRILIGDKNAWGKGLGTEVCEMLTFYGFDRINLNRIYLGYTSGNKGAAKAYTKAGYAYEGTLKEDIYRNSRYYDSIKMGILRKDYYQKYFMIHKRKYKPVGLR